jgi:O-antigen/teichoic acid export membrane protein
MFKRMVMNIGGVSFVLTLMMMFAFVSTVLLGRLLTTEAFGEFSLMRTLVLFIPPLAIWGQDVATARFFSQHDAEQFKWGKALRIVFSIGILLVLIGAFAAFLIYKLTFFKVILLFLACSSYIATLFFSNLVRGQQKYMMAIMMMYGFRACFVIVVGVMYFFKVDSAFLAFASYYAIIIILSLANGWYTFRAVPQGEKIVPKEMHTTGLLFMGSQASVTILGSLDSLFIPTFLDLSSLALYQAAVAPSQLFNIVGRAGKYVWVPEFGRSENVRVLRISILVGLASMILLISMLLLAKPLLHLLFDGKYDQGAPILRILAIAGTIRLFYNLSSSVVIGKMDRQALYYHLGMTIIMVFVEIFFLIYMLKHYGVMGAAISVLIVTFIRTVASYLIIWKFRTQLNSSTV